MEKVGVIYSVGHSNLAAEAFFALLHAHRVRTLADVRAFPGSRRHPHFGQAALATSCAEQGIAYEWIPALGGRRRAVIAASPHIAWKVTAFRNYADYMDTEDFLGALRELEHTADAAATAFMCAEALWWQCHRRLIADRLLVFGWDVRHIGTTGALAPHTLPPFARVEGERIIYDRGMLL